MDKSEIAALLTLCASYDSRNIDEADVEAWHLALGDLTGPECMKAVVEYYQDETEHQRIWPGNVRQAVLAARTQWLRAHPGVGPQNPEMIPPWRDAETWKRELDQ